MIKLTSCFAGANVVIFYGSFSVIPKTRFWSPPVVLVGRLGKCSCDYIFPVVEQIGAILCNNRTKCGKSMKFGTV